MDAPNHHARGRKRITEEHRGGGHHGLPMVDATVCAVSISYEAVHFLAAFQLPSSF